ncbi:MAG: T9SS type A sorting domain-containing protein [Salinivirgaceae bacterium]|nr:T9SS type A sorting domain-containing protein [Salinivirgaceae bacterium]
MKKLLLLFSFPLLFVANLSFAQTQQSVVNEILSKTEYRNVLGFLNALTDTAEYNPLLKDFFCYGDDQNVLFINSIQPYIDKGTIRYASINENPYDYGYNFNYLTDSDSINICEGDITFCGSYWGCHLCVSYILTNGKLSASLLYQNYSYMPRYTPYTIKENEYTEVPYFQVSFVEADTSIMFYGKKMYLKYDKAHINLKNELLDNDLQGRMLTTNLSNSDSVFYSIDGGSNWQELPKYILFDEAKDITVKNYYNGCSDSVTFVKDNATEMPRIHDTIYITKTDTIYITKTDTVYIEKEPNKTAIIDKQTNLNVWPNPATAFVNAEAEEAFSYTLLNNAGIILKKEEGESSYTISMSEYPDGIYYIKTSDGVIRKIVKK